MKKFFWKLGITISLEWGLYFLWTKIYRFLWQRKYKGNVPVRKTLEEIRDKIRGRNWKQDSWRELGDAIGYPRYFEEVGNAGSLGLDCDDFSAWILNAGREGFKHNNFVWFPEGLLTVVWKEGSSLAGHNVALFKTFSNSKSVLGHVSNWRGGFLYEFPDFTYEQVAKDISMRAGNKTLVAWRLTTPDLQIKMGSKIYL